MGEWINNAFEWTIENLWPFFVALVIIVILGVFLFFVTGFIFVKKGKIAVVEKLGGYIGLYTKTTYFTPLLFRRVGYYVLGPQKITIQLPNGNTASLIYEITNAILFHYHGHNIIQEIKNTYELKEDITLQLISLQLERVGVKLINIEQITAKK